jgi:hypothetical protein
MTLRTSPYPAKSAAAKAFNFFNLVSWTIGAKGSNIINCTAQLLDARGQALLAPAFCTFYLSDSSDGHTLTATPLTSVMAIGTNGVIFEADVTEKAARVITSAAGLFDINLTQTASPVAYYGVIVMPDGSLAVSPIVQF